MERALTTGEIAKQLGWPLHRVQYLVRTRQIEPTARAGILRLFDPAILERLRTEARQEARYSA